MTANTILIWRNARDGDLCGAQGLLRWRSFTRRPGDEFFTPYGESGQLGTVARSALGDALRRSTNVFVGWQAEDPAITPAADVEAAVAKLWPVTIFAPERAIDGPRWVMSSFGEAAMFSKGAVARSVLDFCAMHYPHWQPGAHFRPHAVMLRVDTTAEALGLVAPRKVMPDDIFASVATDPAVLAAGKLWDRATPSTHCDLVAAVLAAQARAGVPVDERAPLSSGDVEDYLTPLLMRMGKGDERDVVAQMRRDMRRRFGEFAEVVLLFMLRTYQHRDTSALLAIAIERAAA